jgi:hypothetical protein
MRPTTTRDITFSIGNYYFNNGASIPQNLAVELSPTLLNPNLSLKKFQENSFWYSSALSIGTKVNTDKSYAIGIGLKFKLIDKQDLRKDKAYLSMLTDFSAKDANAYNKAIKEVVNDQLANNNSAGKTFIELQIHVNDAYQKNNTAEEKAIREKIDKIMAKNKVDGYNDIVNNVIPKYRDSVKRSNWNKLIWDIGTATLLNSKDSLLRNIKAASKIGIWTTAGIPLGPKGQLLIGYTAQWRDTINSNLGVSTHNIGLRAYYGANDLKTFIEGNALFANTQKNTLKASIGIETTFFGGLWMDFSLGISQQGNARAVFTPGFNVFFANGEKKK